MLLGAGASAATLGKRVAPVSTDFGKVLTTSFPRWRTRFPFLHRAVIYLEDQETGTSENDWRLDAVWNGIDENLKLAGIIANDNFEWPTHVPPGKRLYRLHRRSWRSFWLLAGWELRRALAMIYGTKLKKLLRKRTICNKWLASRLHQLYEEDVVASTNYDLLAESIIRWKWSSASNCRDEHEYRSRTNGQGPLILKLHGSLDWLFQTNWITNRSFIDRTPDGGPITDPEIDLDQDFRETRPLVVAPVRYKDELVFPSVQPAELVEVLNFQWQRFVDAVARADELVVLGYRFPPEDSYGNRLLQEAIRLRPVTPRLKVQLHLPNYECKGVKKNVAEMIFGPKKSEVSCCGPIPL